GTVPVHRPGGHPRRPSSRSVESVTHQSGTGRYNQPAMAKRKTRKKTRRQQRLRSLKSRLRWYGFPVAGVLVAVWVTLRFSLLAPDPPRNPDNLCEIFREHPAWYDYAVESRERWGSPV